MPTSILFAGFPSAIVHALDPANPDRPPAKLKAVKQLLWGDYMSVISQSQDGQLYRVKVRGVEGWIKASETQANRILEIVFVDIGQGDGALVVTPDDKKYVIDAGQGDNMYRFLRWRFGFRKKVVFDAAIMSHSDADHYGGFDYLFDEPNASFKTVYQNGLMERVASSATGTLGKPEKVVGDGSFITDLVEDLPGLRAFLATPANWKKKKFPTMLEKGLSGGRFGDYRMLDVTHGHLPGHGPGAKLEIQVLGPWPEDANGKRGLRWFGDVGKTKNGHSVVLRFLYNGVKIFMGGDLNIESCRLLLEKHTGLSAKPKNAEEEAELVTAAREIFGCDVAKACHHGSADTLLPFMKSIHPIATVISSGDDEPHAHPRADALGAIARCSRGERPLLLSTELARSAKETIKQPSVLRQQLRDLAKKIDDATDPQKKAAAQKKFDAVVSKLERSIAIYGAINLRTDGERVVMAYKLERSTPSKGWDIYKLERAGEKGPLIYRSKYD
ncbi:MAG: MBL fold metallo-hydrolase [Verrucomicrobiae bacterium]|nr:MBL fold metallo-hydrolase [Verrucomicrobiae bacterium]